MFKARTRSYLSIFRLLIAAVLGTSAVALVALTYRWPLVWDAQVFHYIHFLMENGFAPYRDIPDINMPGVYVIEGWAMHLFGGGDLAWRIYDFTLMGLLTLAMIVIALPYDWMAGLFAGVIFALAHECEGPRNTAQRDEVMTVLILIAYAVLFEALRRHKPWMLFASGLSLGMAVSVKPTVAPLGLLLLVMAAWSLKKQGQAFVSYIGWGLAGAATAGVIVLAFLAGHHAIGDFLFSLKSLTSFYTGLDRASAWTMLRHVIPRGAAIVLPFAIVVALADKQWRNWERWTILLGVAFGAFSYFVQRKGYSYHTYPLAAFVLLWAALELMIAMQTPKWTRAVGIAGLAAGIFVAIPTYCHRLLAFTSSPVNDYTVSLESDLAQMGGDRLQHQVQCFDLVDGCFNALYHLRLVQSTGNIGDLILFAPEKSPVVDQSRDKFWNDMESNPPSVIVLSNEWFNRPATFDKINMWPRFADYLGVNYHLVIARTFSREGNEAYRIYVRNGVSLPVPQHADSVG